MFVLILGVLHLLLSPAAAAACNGNDAPPLYTGRMCSSICAYTTTGSGDFISCSPGNGSTVAGTKFFAATDFSAGSHTFSFWGTDGDGVRFCCAFDETNEVEYISAWGNSADDEMYFSNATGTISLADPGGSAPFDLYMAGNPGDDSLHSSRSTTVDVMMIDGAGGEDELYCYVDSVADGDGGDDQLTGSGAFLGNSGQDTLSGDDLVFGGTDDDGISAGSGNDTVYGNGGADDVCGESGTDTLYGGDDADRVTGGASFGDYANGGAGSDECSAETEVSCEDVTVIPPTSCP